MKKKPYFPTNDKELNSWLTSFTVKLPTVATELNVKPAELTQVQTLSTNFKNSFDLVVQIDNDKQKAVEQKNLDRQALIDYYRPLIQRIKTHSNYSTADHGEYLDIIGSEQAVDIENLQPTLKIKLLAEHPRIIWKKTVADAIKIFVDRLDGNGFQFLALDTKPDYIDTCEMPSGKDSVVWKYKAVYIINDAEAGKYSEVASVTVTKQV